MKSDTGFFEQHDVDMRDCNTMHISATVKNLVFPYSKDGIEHVFEQYGDKKIVVIGVGSNLIFCQQYYGDEYLFISTQFLNKIRHDNEKIYVEAGVTMSKLAWYALERHSDGFWFMEDIPGSVGGGIIMNAGTHDGSIMEIIDSVTVYNADSHVFENYCDAQALFGFRNSVFQKKKCLIVSAAFRIKEGDYNKIVIEMTEQKKQRYLKQPRDYPSAGSVFKTPIVNGEAINCWKLLKDAGLSGSQIGGAKVSEKHSGFIVNVGNATGQDMCSLVDYCINQVYAHSGVKLEPEWKFI